MSDLREQVARAVRRNKFERTGRAAIVDETLPLTDGELAEAIAALSVAIEAAARVAENVPVEAFRVTYPEDEAWPELTEKVVKPVKRRVASAIRALKPKEGG